MEGTWRTPAWRWQDSAEGLENNYKSSLIVGLVCLRRVRDINESVGKVQNVNLDLFSVGSRVPLDTQFAGHKTLKLS